MKRGKENLPEGAADDGKTKTPAENNDKRREQASSPPAAATLKKDADGGVESGDGVEGKNPGRKPSNSLQPSKGPLKKKWTLTAAKKRNPSSPREAPLAEDKGESSTAEPQNDEVPSRGGSVAGPPPSASRQGTLPCRPQFPEADTETAYTRGARENEEKRACVNEPPKVLVKPPTAKRPVLTPTAAIAAGHTSPQGMERERNEQGIPPVDRDGSHKDQKACLICVRVRPESLQEISSGGSLCVDTRHGSAGTVVVSGFKDRQYSFHFDYVFDQDATQEAIYRSTCESLLEKLMAGYSATVMAYGQTGAGKTYTMLGEIAEHDFHRALTDPTTRGVVPRLLEALFQRIVRETEDCSQTEGGADQQSFEDGLDQKEEGNPGVTFSVRASLVEVYNDSVRDLLAPSREALCIRDNVCPNANRVNSAAVLTEATEVPVATAQEAFALIYAGFARRAQGTTLLNDKSSRSHAIFQLIIRRNSMTACRVTCSRLCLVDLAGSERVSKADSSGARLKEAQSINKSLLALGNVINALPQSQKKGAKAYVPYRDSKLTRLLQHSFGGHTFTVLLLCCSPHTFNVKETLSTLRFGDRAANLKNEPLSVEAVDPELLLHRLQEAQTELRISQAQVRAYIVQTARQVDAIKMLQGYVPQDIQLSEDEQTLLRLAMQEVPVLTPQQRLQLYSAKPAGAPATPRTASSPNRALRVPAAHPGTYAPGAQRRDPSSTKALENTQGQRRLPQQRGRMGENSPTRPRTAPYQTAARPATSVLQRGSPAARRPVDQRRVQRTPSRQPEQEKRSDVGANQTPAAQSGEDNKQGGDAAEPGAAAKSGAQNDAASKDLSEKAETREATVETPGTTEKDTKKDEAKEQEPAQSASKNIAGKDTEKDSNANGASRDKNPSRLSKFFSLSRGKSVSTKAPDVPAGAPRKE